MGYPGIASQRSAGVGKEIEFGHEFTFRSGAATLPAIFSNQEHRNVSGKLARGIAETTRRDREAESERGEGQERQ